MWMAAWTIPPSAMSAGRCASVEISSGQMNLAKVANSVSFHSWCTEMEMVCSGRVSDDGAGEQGGVMTSADAPDR